MLDEVDALVEDSKNFMGVTMGLDREEFFALTEKIRVALPDEVRKASRVTADSEKIVSSARESAEHTLLDAQQEAQRIQQTAGSSAERVTRESESRAQQRIQESETAAARILSEAKSQAGHMVEQAQQMAERAIEDAQREAEQMISESEILRRANAQAKEIVTRAEYDSIEMRRGGEQFAREELVRLEKVLTDGLLTVQRGRMKLDQRIGGGVDHNSSAPPRQQHANGRHAEAAGLRR